MPPTTLDRFRGCILGHAIGDALGAPFETMPGDAIYYGFGAARRILADPPGDLLEYTDDTQMAIGVAETLIAHGAIRRAELMRAFASNFDAARAYGAGAHQIIEMAAKGGDWAALAQSIFPGGSLGNGAAMRAAPIGLFFRHNLDRVDEQAVESALVTHTHPVGIDGTRIFALAIANLMEAASFDRSQFYDQLINRAGTEEFRDALETASRLGPDDSIARLGVSVAAHRSVPTAIACFASSPDSYADAVGRAIGLGGDVDTIAGMTGALSGAYLGIDAIPAHLLARLENGNKGRTYLDDLARQLHDRAPVERSL